MTRIKLINADKALLRESMGRAMRFNGCWRIAGAPIAFHGYPR
jgi:hypothetical protein